MPKRVGQITINLVAGTADFNANMAKAKASVLQLGPAVKQASHDTVSSIQASSAAIRLFEGGLTNNLRAVERFVAGTLKLGPVLKAAFPVVGALAFAGLVYEMGTKVQEFFKKLAEMPAKLRSAFREIENPIGEAADELDVANAKLQNSIDRLQGKTENTLAQTLAEAKVAADKLGDSLERDVDALMKLLHENELSLPEEIFGNLNNEASKALQVALGGISGVGGIRAELQKIRDKEAADLEALKTGGGGLYPDEFPGLSGKSPIHIVGQKPRGQFSSMPISVIGQDKLQLKGADAVRHAADESAAKLWQTAADGLAKALAAPDLPALNRELFTHVRNIALAEARKIPKATREQDLKQKEEEEQAKNRGQIKERPFNDRILQLGAEAKGAALKLEAVGGTQASQEKAKAEADSLKVIAEVNKQLEHHHTVLNIDQEAQIRSIEKVIVHTEAEAAFQNKIHGSISALVQRTITTEMLTAAIGQGYEATKKANVELRVMQELGANYFDSDYMDKHAAQVKALRAALGEEQGSQHTQEITQNTQALRDQLAVQMAVVAATNKGAEAERKAALEAKIRQMERDGATPEQVALTRGEAGGTRLKANADELKTLTDKIAATRQLAAAQMQGTDGVRRAQQDIETRRLRDQGFSPQVIDKATQASNEEYYAQITSKVVQAVNANRQRRLDLDAEDAILKSMLNTTVDQVAREAMLNADLKERIQMRMGELDQSTKMSDGVKSFFTEMQQEAKQTAAEMRATLDAAFNGIAHNMTMLITGGKTGFADLFKSIGRQMIETQLKHAAAKGLVALGKKFGIEPETPRDGQSDTTGFFVEVVNGGGAGQNGMSGVGEAFKNLPKKADGASGFFQAVLGAFGVKLGGAAAASGAEAGTTPFVNSNISYMADGGLMSANRAYIVGEKGPELMTGTSARVTSNAETRKLMAGGDTHMYTIDARGTDPVLTEQRVKAAIVAAHNSAVSKSVQANQERQRRTPNPQRAA